MKIHEYFIRSWVNFKAKHKSGYLTNSTQGKIRIYNQNNRQIAPIVDLIDRHLRAQPLIMLDRDLFVSLPNCYGHFGSIVEILTAEGQVYLYCPMVASSLLPDLFSRSFQDVIQTVYYIVFNGCVFSIDSVAAKQILFAITSKTSINLAPLIY